MQTPKEQNTLQLHRIKTVNTRKTKGSNAYGESHSVAGGEGAGAPAPTAAGSSMSIPYRAWPWAWGKGCLSPRHVSEYPEVEERQGALEQTINCPSTSVRTEPRGHGSGCSLVPGGLVLPPGTAHSPEGVGLSQRFVPPSSQASSTGQRRRQTQALQRTNIGDLHVSPKHESEPVVSHPHLLTPSRPLKVSHS